MKPHCKPRSSVAKRTMAAFSLIPAARLDDLGVRIGYEFEPATYNTLAGLIYHHLGHVAQAGDRVDLPGLEIVVEATDGYRLVEVRVTKPPTSEAQQHSTSPQES